MIARRDLMAGLACIGALAGAEWLRPRRELLLMRPGAQLKAIIPLDFGSWRGGEGGDIVIPRVEGSLSTRIYSDQLGRIYRNDNDAGANELVMLLAAYGKSQSDSLQLHRPEVCYPANGFQIASRELIGIPVGSFVIPAVALTAVAGSRVEDIIYWTRLGKGLPQTAGEQRSDRLKAAMAGYVADGVLVRASVVREGGNPAFPLLRSFMTQLVVATASDDQPALVGRTVSPN